MIKFQCFNLIVRDGTLAAAIDRFNRYMGYEAINQLVKDNVLDQTTYS